MQYRRKEQQERLAKLITYLHDLEQVNPEAKNVIAQWKEFVRLPTGEQTKRKQEWEDYYQMVNQSSQYSLLQEQKKAAKANNWKRVKELAEQAKQMRTIPQPAHPDPWEFDHGWVQVYREVERVINTLKHQLAVSEETAGIWSEEEAL